jgi:hypothetical protein
MSQLTVGEMQPERSKEYIQMFFMPSKKVRGGNYVILGF